MMPCNKRFTNRVTLSLLEIRSLHFYTRLSQARVVEERSGFVVHSTDRIIIMINQQSWWRIFLRLQIAPEKRNSTIVIRLSDIAQNELIASGSICRQRMTLCIKKKVENYASVNSKHHHPPPSPPGDPRGFALYCCPGAGVYTCWPSPGAGFLHIHKIRFSTVKKYTFTQLAFRSYLHALHSQFRLSILAWLNTKIWK